MFLLDQIKEIVKGEYKVTYNGEEYASFDEVKSATRKAGLVVVESIQCIDGTLCVSLIDNPIPRNEVTPEWEKQHKEQFGTDISLF